jgi:hypothetical protein
MTPVGMRLLHAGVTERLDTYAYAKVLSTLAAACAAPDENPLLAPLEAGRLAATLKPVDRDGLVRAVLGHVSEGAAEAAAWAVRFVVTALPEDDARQLTALQQEAMDAVVDALASRPEPQLADALREAFPRMSLSYALWFSSVLRKAPLDGAGAPMLADIRDEFSSMRGWRRQRRA